MNSKDKRNNTAQSNKTNTKQDILAGIKLLLMDVDGVMTDGKITYTDSGEEIKSFSVKDGLGLRLLMDSGVKAGIITGRSSGALKARCKNLGIDILYDGIKDKKEALNTILALHNMDYQETAFAGDDLPDIEVMKMCGISFAVADAAKEVADNADFITVHRGGDGAVREICEEILKAKGIWYKIIESFNHEDLNRECFIK
ncbi:3-deoxy-D-manno-octulosonate 8-phosphate phosphatase [Desulfamplus magnetovallimortis]|uniref:3-deoxy-D-manno-octulosonate 8-phosphate phosphatase n=1 Tax=Desulfamplus magnetovallimortis TaxID=1246637 RepID=A0A1W1H4Q8_9BACT|nr:HAD-IIIA family hydrolase [Desulfamplus magnetovallimortis]SLM27436.1 3-deoxy-D-manno-octulosonate 8-phosphate phosphatase [Desulfamplus magnetovallimortis]